MLLFQVVLAGAFYPNYFTFGQPDEEMAVRELAGKDPKTTVVVGDTENSVNVVSERASSSVAGAEAVCARINTVWISPREHCWLAG